MEQERLKILVVGHRPYPVLDDPIYVPIQAGRKISGILLPRPWIGDDTGENISGQNGEFCELTALYWAWKNLPDAEYLGLCHYRRYFYPRPTDFANGLRRSWEILKLLGNRAKAVSHLLDGGVNGGYVPQDNIAFETLKENSAAVKRKIYSVLGQDYQVIVPRPLVTASRTLSEHYAHDHIASDLSRAVETLVALHPDYEAAASRALGDRKFFYGNMFIMKRTMFVEYCEWMFPILFELRKATELSVYPDYQRRVFGFLSERMFTIWLQKNRVSFRVKEMKVARLLEG